jgi:transcriptional antiterminator RfaH
VTDPSDSDSWYLAQTKPRQLARARINLERQGFTVFVPERDETIRRQGRFVTEARPLFPGYIFVHIEPARSWSPVRSTFGIARIVTFGSGGPTRVPRNVVRALFARFAERGTESALRQGMEVRIVKGPLAQLIARIEEASEADRIRVLLELMSGTVKTTISRGALEVL